MTTTNKGGRSIPGSKNRFDVKPEIFVLKVERGTKATQSSTHAHKLNKCNKAEKLAEILSNMGSQQLLGGPVLPRS